MILPVFGALPSGSRAERIRSSPNYRNGQFQNPEPTEMMIASASTLQLMAKFFNKPAITRPPKALPFIKVSQGKHLHEQMPVITWYGHSSYSIGFAGKLILVDPVFSGYASPFPFFAKAFEGTGAYKESDFEKVDLLIITHDHFDHLDYHTVLKLSGRTDKIITSLGVGAHLEAWGVPPEKITELDWWQSSRPFDGLTVTAAPARHFSGRTFKRNQSLWSSFALKWGEVNLFLGGDSGYGAHFREIGTKLGPFAIAILEAGQYNSDWPFIHMFPEEAVTACRDLRAGAILPVHWGKFALAFHPWNEPPERIRAAFAGTEIRAATPMIGEPIGVNGEYPDDPWWETK